jgi:transcriptional regulator with XRE-family HTH domain
LANNTTLADIVGRNVKRRRIEAGLTQLQLAAALGALADRRPDLFRRTSQGSISNIERRGQSPTVETLAPIAFVLGITTAALIEGCDEHLAKTGLTARDMAHVLGEDE